MSSYIRSHFKRIGFLENSFKCYCRKTPLNVIGTIPKNVIGTQLLLRSLTPCATTCIQHDHTNMPQPLNIIRFTHLLRSLFLQGWNHHQQFSSDYFLLLGCQSLN